ncbi:MAG: PTS sugar transporter subunit IIA [bacterium]
MLPPGILAEHRISLDNPAVSKKKALQISAELLAAGLDEVKPDAVFEKLLERERLGSTGMNSGIAIPHARVSGVRRPRGALIKLREPINFDAMDGEPVDIVFALMVPEEADQTHLDLLASLARAFSSKAVCQHIRNAQDTDDILLLLTTIPDETPLPPSSQASSQSA